MSNSIPKKYFKGTCVKAIDLNSSATEITLSSGLSVCIWGKDSVSVYNTENGGTLLEFEIPTKEN
jgi:hypothetical protein